MKRTLVGLVFSLLLLSMFSLAFSIQSARGSDTIYIYGDYTFAGNIYEPLVVMADNVVIDGNGYTLQGSGEWAGIDLEYRNNVTVKNVKVTNFSYGILLEGSSSNTLSGNTIFSNKYVGINLYDSSNNVLSGNNASSNGYEGISLYGYSNNNVLSDNTLSEHYDAISLGWANNNTLSGNTISNNDYGIWHYGSSNNVISDNIVINNDFGIWLYESNNNTLSGNTVSSNNNDGIILSWSNSNVLSGNIASDNNDGGISLWTSNNNNVITGNNVSNNILGIYLWDSCNNNILSGNNLSGNYYGIQLDSSNNNVLSGNTASNSYDKGIWFWNSNNNVITGNNVSNNNKGIHIGGSSNNILFHNNFIGNTIQAIATPKFLNTWDDGYPSGGNYWSDYTGVDVKSGPDQDQPSSDIIGDSTLVIDVNNQDRYPLMVPWGAPPPPSYPLTIYSSPSGVTFTVDGAPSTTPWTGIYSEGALVSLVMPETHDGYVWSAWYDGETNRDRAVTVNEEITLSGFYHSAVGGKATQIVIPANNLRLLAPYIGLMILLAGAIVTVAYATKRKREPK